MKIDFTAFHASSSRINAFDIDNFRENCLDIDTEQFGLYYIFVYKNHCSDAIAKGLMYNTARYGLRHGNDTGYMYVCDVNIDDSRMIDPNAKMDIETFKTLMRCFRNASDEFVENIYNKTSTNLYLIKGIVKNLHNAGRSWSEIAKYLINSGFDGYIDGSTDFGTVVLFNSDIIEIREIYKYNQPRDFMNDTYEVL